MKEILILSFVCLVIFALPVNAENPKALYVSNPDVDLSTYYLYNALIDEGFEVIQSEVIPISAEMEQYDLVIVHSDYAAHQISAEYMKSYIANGGGTVIFGGYPTHFTYFTGPHGPASQTTYDLSGISEWFGTAQYRNVGWERAYIAIDYPFGTDLISGQDLGVYCSGWGCAAVSDLHPDDTQIIVTWTNGYIAAFTHTYVDGRVFYYAAGNDELLKAGALWAANVPTNNPPIADADGPYVSSNEGSLITLDASGSSDPDGSIVNYEWDFNNDGQYDDATGVNPNIVFDDDGSFIVGLKVTDDDGGVGTDTLTVIVNNVAPTITSLTGPIDPVEDNNAVSLFGDFTDPGLDDMHTAIFDWGDTTSTYCTLTNGERGVIGTHTYTEAGVYTVTLTVTDDDGGIDSEIFQYVVVYDPDGGFVTGGGWINSLVGTYAADPMLTGKASFGFVSKYQKGQTTPTGNTEFQLRAGDLNFHSSSYDWLVIAGPKAMYKGTGTINGVGSYGFMFSAIDEKLTPSTDVDMFRIKIWDKDNNDAVVYDNQIDADDDAGPTTAIQGGNIVIHK